MVGALLSRQPVGTVAAPQRVRAAAAAEQVGQVVARQHVRQPIAGAVPGRGAGQDQVLEIGAQHIADRQAADGIAPAARRLEDGVLPLGDIGVVPGAAIQRVAPRAPRQPVVAQRAPQAVVPGAGPDPVVCGVAGQHVVARSRCQVLDHRAGHDRDVPAQPVGMGYAARDQGDDLVRAVPRQVQRVHAARVDDGEGDLAARAGFQQVGHPLVVAARSAVLAIDGIAGPQACRAVKRAHGRDVGHHRRHHPGEAGIDEGVLVLVEIGHDRGLPTVVDVKVVISVFGPAVVVAGMAQAQGMADLVDVGLEGIAGKAGAIGCKPVLPDVDRRTFDIPAQRERLRIGAAACIIQRDVDGLAGRRRGVEADPGHVRPRLERGAGQPLPRPVQARDVHVQHLPRGDVERTPRRSDRLPVSVGQLLRDLRDGVDGIGHLQAIGPRSARLIGPCLQIIGAGGGHGHRQARIQPRTRIVVLGDKGAAGVVKAQVGVA